MTSKIWGFTENKLAAWSRLNKQKRRNEHRQTESSHQRRRCKSCGALSAVTSLGHKSITIGWPRLQPTPSADRLIKFMPSSGSSAHGVFVLCVSVYVRVGASAHARRNMWSCISAFNRERVGYEKQNSTNYVKTVFEKCWIHHLAESIWQVRSWEACPSQNV